MKNKLPVEFTSKWYNEDDTFFIFGFGFSFFGDTGGSCRQWYSSRYTHQKW